MSALSYAGVGPRKTPSRLRTAIMSAASQLSIHGFTLHSGGADGFDSFVEHGADPSLKKIFLPWQGFRGYTSPLFGASTEAYEIAKRYHPKWSALTRGGRACMSRSSYQVLGEDLRSPVKFVFTWTFRGHVVGGTGQALRIAAAHKIPVFNMGLEGETVTAMLDYAKSKRAERECVFRSEYCCIPKEGSATSQDAEDCQRIRRALSLRKETT